jgi:predicted aspartyl protease
MSMLLSRVLLALTAFGLSTMTAAAQDCGPLKKVSSLDMTFASSGQVMVPVGINGTTEKFLLNTAGGRSTLSQSAIASLGLKSVDIGRGSPMNTAGGNASRRVVTISNLSLGTIQGKNIELMVDPNANMGSNAKLPVAGSLADDLVENGDFELDFAAAKLNYFSTDHCDGHVVYWTSTAPAILEYRATRPGATNTPFDSHIRFHVTVDGKDMLAVLATGAAISTMTTRAAKALYDLSIDSPDTVPLGTPDGDPNHRAFGYIFKTMNFGGVSVINPRVRIAPDIMGENDPDNRFGPSDRAIKIDDNRQPDMIIGMDVLRKLHIYVAAHGQKLYITAAAATLEQ